jgi:hypothetical protein
MAPATRAVTARDPSIRALESLSSGALPSRSDAANLADSGRACQANRQTADNASKILTTFPQDGTQIAETKLMPLDNMAREITQTIFVPCPHNGMEVIHETKSVPVPNLA